MSKSPKPTISCQILDTSTGRPAARLETELYKKNGDSWERQHSATTPDAGNVQFSYVPNTMSSETYKLKFEVGDYYSRFEKKTLYPYVEVAFKVKDGDYLIPLLLSPYGYSTYSGF